MYDLVIDDTGTGKLTLKGDLTIQHVQELKQSFQDVASQAKELHLKFTDVERADLAGLQILCTAHRSLVKGGIPVIIAGKVPAALREASDAAGFKGCVSDDDQSGLWTGG
ncbi:MAG: STAS domain-containing protein [Magnetococcales bacterium]|nr:STAS domain-containing protein [Magnetococcales bacterium]